MSSKTKTILLWTSIVLLTLIFANASFQKLSGRSVENFIRWGYDSRVMYLVGTFECLGVIGLWVPKLRRWAAMGLIALMIGAIYTHLNHHEAPFIVINLVAAVLSWGVIRLSR